MYAFFTQCLIIAADSSMFMTYGDDRTKPHLGNAGIYSGQIWTISSLAWNDSGSGLHLDGYRLFIGDLDFDASKKLGMRLGGSVAFHPQGMSM
jgi:hypothetical protein